MKKVTIGLSVALTIGTALATTLQTSSAERKTIWNGVYTDAQATTGQPIYEEFCRGCHGVNLEGGASQGAPPLRGEKFMENWREDNLGSLFTKIRTTMPLRESKVLTDGEALHLVAYILRANEFPTGSELTHNVLSATQIERKDGPKPLPNYSVVQVVGCLTPDGDNWTLTMAGQPSRYRNSELGAFRCCWMERPSRRCRHPRVTSRWVGSTFGFSTASLPVEKVRCRMNL